MRQLVRWYTLYSIFIHYFFDFFPFFEPFFFLLGLGGFGSTAWMVNLPPITSLPYMYMQFKNCSEELMYTVDSLTYPHPGASLTFHLGFQVLLGYVIFVLFPDFSKQQLLLAIDGPKSYKLHSKTFQTSNERRHVCSNKT